MNRALAQNSLWEATAAPATDFSALTGAAEAEVLVVGAGFAGLSTAIHLAERGVAVTVLEAQRVGHGASGRNGGQVLHGGKHSKAELVARFGEGAGSRLDAFARGAADAAFHLIDRLGLRCDAHRGGSIYCADSAVGLAETKAKLRSLQGQGIDARWLDAAALHEATGSGAYLGGYFNPKGGSVQPLSLVRELARAAHRAGATLHEHSPASAIRRDGSGWEVQTPHGRVKARRVLFATNGRPGALWPRLEAAVLPVWSFQVATAPLPEAAGVLPGGPVVSDTRRVLRYFRRDRHGRAVMGGKGTIRAPQGPASFEFQRRALERLYPQLQGQPIEFWWGGQVSVTLDRLPRLFSLGENLLAHVACNGKGVAWNLAIGPVLADALSGVPLDTLGLPPAQPLHGIPFHFLKQAYTAAGGAWLRLRDSMDRGALSSTREFS